MTSHISTLSSSRNQRDYSPVSWTQYFDEAHDILINNENINETSTQDNSFRVYLKNFRQPYAPKREFGQKADLSKIELSEAEISHYSKVPTLVALHGGGYSGLTWAEFTKYIEQYCHCRILAIDLRAHGDTKTSNDDCMDIDTLVSDVIAVTHTTHQICGFRETPNLVLIGHSMGGAIAVNCATKCTQSLPSLIGFVIIDVVEGTAKDALPQMMSVIKTRPTKFPSLSNAIEWIIRSGMAKNSDAARVSMPSNLVNIADGRLSIHDVSLDEEQETSKTRMLENLNKHKFHISVDQLIGQNLPTALIPPKLPLPPRLAALKGTSPSQFSPISSSTVINEELEDEADVLRRDDKCDLQIKQDGENIDNDGYKKPPDVEKSGYTWRTNLAKTQPYWNGWFEGLSAQLLSAPVQGKFLLLAGIDRLDKALTIGHMQGKFMMKVLPKCGHAVHEDVPEQVALAIGDFLVRNKFAVAIDNG